MPINTEEELDRFLFEASGLEYPGDMEFKPAPPKSIAEYRAKMSSRKPGLFDDNTELEGATYFISGRGKYNPGKIIRPGELIKSKPEDDDKIRRQIREVSGLGYRNEIIEKNLSRQKVTVEDIATGFPDLSLRCNESHGDSSSSSATSISSPRESPHYTNKDNSSSSNGSVKTLKNKKTKKYPGKSAYHAYHPEKTEEKSH